MHRSTNRHFDHHLIPAPTHKDRPLAEELWGNVFRYQASPLMRIELIQSVEDSTQLFGEDITHAAESAAATQKSDEEHPDVRPPGASVETFAYAQLVPSNAKDENHDSAEGSYSIAQTAAATRARKTASQTGTDQGKNTGSNDHEAEEHSPMHNRKKVGAGLAQELVVLAIENCARPIRGIVPQCKHLPRQEACEDRDTN